MEEIKNLLAQWEEDGVGSGFGIEKAYLILQLLVDKIEELDAKANG
jgi:hypothetical protein